MKRIFLAATLALSLAGCVSGPNGTTTFLPTASVANPVTATSLYDIKATYAIAQAGANTYIQRYRDGFRCTRTRLESVTNLCSRRSIVVKMQDADRKAQIALGKADTFILNNPQLDASSVISAAQIAVTTFYQVQQNAVQ
jgi:hypothetical protein